MPKRQDPLYLRGGVWWCRVRNGSGRIVRRSTRCKQYDAAVLEFRNFEREAVDQDYAAASKASFAECVVDYFADLKRRRVSEAYEGIARVKCGQLARTFENGDLPMSRLDAARVHKHIDQRQAEGTGDFTIKMELMHLRQVLRLARHHGKFHVEVDRVMPPFFRATPQRRRRAPSLPELEAIMRQLEPRRAAHVAFIVATGSRRGESFRARRSDVTPTVVRIRGTKTELAAGDVPVTRLTKALLDWSLAHAPGADVLFHPWGNMGRDLKNACARAGIDAVTPNDLRRAFATWHRQAGVSAEVVSKLLRHATDTLAQTTYARITAADVGALVEKTLLLAPAPGVSTVYQDAAPTAENRANALADDASKFAEVDEKAGAPDKSRTCDLGFRKADENVCSDGHIARENEPVSEADEPPSVPVLYIDAAGAWNLAESLTTSAGRAAFGFASALTAVRRAHAAVYGGRAA